LIDFASILKKLPNPYLLMTSYLGHELCVVPVLLEGTRAISHHILKNALRKHDPNMDRVRK
jgi:hypothetical protein